MDLEEFEQMDKQLKKEGKISREAASGIEDQLISEEQPEDETKQLDEVDQSDEATSPEAIMQAYKDATLLAQEKSREAELYRRILEQTNLEKQHLKQRTNDEAFIREMRSAYQTDPVAATAVMIRRMQDEILDSVDDRIEQALQEDRDFKRLLDDFLSDPANSKLRPYEDELQFLIRDKGLHASEAAELLKKIEEKGSRSSNRRSAVAKEIRNRSMVESDGEIGEPLDDDKEFERTIRKAKSLDEMFSSLGKLKI
ncbi:MAG: hypothetical protein HY912_02975 [Desulfomonile tiedjei]|uniref:Uncharacterized protein n=1 Tax=Desulfomonile tiedjei TaxID=2358 RepID=A0A9D6UXW7_9BACT|nr:hypothetical protein [Desulfomonile tiedjei]